MGRDALLERSFEDDVCAALAERGWTYVDGARDAGWDAGLALYGADVLSWLSGQYPVEYAKAVPETLTGPRLEKAQRKLLEHLAAQLDKPTLLNRRTGVPSAGLLGALHSGFDYAQTSRPAARFGPMVAFPPANPILTAAVAASEANVLRVIRQVHFDTATGGTIDLVLCANGIPVATIELKTDNTQSIEDAIEQYRAGRKPGRTRRLLVPGRGLVHFAVSSTQVYMTSALAGKDTHFLPFNQGTDDGHAGNPASTTGPDSDYLWCEVLNRPLFLRILQDYALWEPTGRGAKTRKAARAAGATPSGRLVFPRYHQLRAVEKVVADVAAQGPGQRYLIWHSAGSGKTKTIAWMAHRLIRHLDADGNKSFDSVIVVTDRTVLDENVREGIGLLRASDGLVVAVGETGGAKSPQLRRALIEGGHIITCTLQTFPEVLKLIDTRDDLAGRSWCVIADEAHSSQTGASSAALRQLLSMSAATTEDGEELTGDDLLTVQDSAIAQAANLTFVALTATPKAKTLRLFGTQVVDQDGNPLDEWRAFDTYTMAQAIEEGFILDVLRNYTTYQMLATVRDAIGREDYVNKDEAVADMVRFVRLHPTSIAQKVEVVVEHFRRNVMHHLEGHAKAMVVTASRQAAVHWSQEMNAYIASRGYGTEMRTLVAFSGPIEIGDLTLTEAGMNGRSDTADAFRNEDGYKVLIVADKFQTGFDEPRLCAMYVDKKLFGITAVQTLSRLNRTCKGKPNPMVLDFVNDPHDIQSDFQRYYSDAHIDTDIDPQSLYDIGARLDAAGVYDENEMQAVSDAYLDDHNTHSGNYKALNPITTRWNGRVRQILANHDTEAIETARAFLGDLASYKSAWEFLSQIVDYQDPTLRRRAILAAILLPNLRLEHVRDAEDHVTGVTLAGVTVAPDEIEKDYGLTTGLTDALRLPAWAGGGGELTEHEKDAFANVVEEVNKLLAGEGVDLPAALRDGFVIATYEHLLQDDQIRAMAESNTVEQLAKSQRFRERVSDTAVDAVRSQEELAMVVSDPDKLTGLAQGMARLIQLGLERMGESDAHE